MDRKDQIAQVHSEIQCFASGMKTSFWTQIRTELEEREQVLFQEMLRDETDWNKVLLIRGEIRAIEGLKGIPSKKIEDWQAQLEQLAQEGDDSPQPMKEWPYASA